MSWVMRDQMIRFIDGNRLLSPYQSGFRSGHNTATALLKITNDIQRGCDRRMVTLLLLLDFSKAFDNVRRSLLLKKLSLYFKFGGNAVALVGSYLSDRFQCVPVCGILSELIAVTRGVVFTLLDSQLLKALESILSSFTSPFACIGLHFKKSHRFSEGEVSFMRHLGFCDHFETSCLAKKMPIVCLKL
jgi:hypothetical protein